MARNRKRAKERRSRRPTPAQVARPGVATAGGEREAVEPDRELELDPPSPLEHAAPDVELADAQLALGRPELALGDDDGDADPEDSDAETFADELEPDDFDGAGRSGGGGRELAAPGSGGDGRELAPRGSGAAGTAVEPHRPGLGHRLIAFLQGSWRELQRVQWPDRRQVVQATGVVIGFVIVAGVYLGVADTLATRLMNFILK